VLRDFTSASITGWLDVLPDADAKPAKVCLADGGERPSQCPFKRLLLRVAGHPGRRGLGRGGAQLFAGPRPDRCRRPGQQRDRIHGRGKKKIL
jgi:hypothetical protein